MCSIIENPELISGEEKSRINYNAMGLANSSVYVTPTP